MKNNIDVFLVIMGMVIGFTVIIMHLTAIWPCSAMGKIDKFFHSSNHDIGTLKIGNRSLNIISGTHYLLTNLFRCT